MLLIADQREAGAASAHVLPLGWKVWRSLRLARCMIQSGFGIGLCLGEAIQLRQRDRRPQVILAAG